MEANPFTAVDRELLKRCLSRAPGSWNDFVDRFLSLIYHVVNYTAHLRSVRLNPEDVEDIAAEVLLKICANEFKVLREFRGLSSFATYLTVVSRRICIQELVRRQKSRDASSKWDDRTILGEPDSAPAALKGMESLEEVEKMLKTLSGKEREIVRMYYLEGRTYEEISTETEVPVNTIGSVLSRARKKLREAVKSAGGDSLGLDGKATPTVPKSDTPPKTGSVRKAGTGAHPAAGASGSAGKLPAVGGTPGSSAKLPGLGTPGGSSGKLPAVPPKSGMMRKAPSSEDTGPTKPTKPAKPTKPDTEEKASE